VSDGFDWGLRPGGADEPPEPEPIEPEPPAPEPPAPEPTPPPTAAPAPAAAPWESPATQLLPQPDQNAFATELFSTGAPEPTNELFGSNPAPSGDPDSALDALFGETQFRQYEAGVLNPDESPFAAKPDELRSLARELSFMNGVSVALSLEDGTVVRYVLFDNGTMVDEYLSVPEYFGELPPGDAYALGANPTVVGRLTNADPARVRAVARTASSPADLPPAQELYEQIADVFGVQP